MNSYELGLAVGSTVKAATSAGEAIDMLTGAQPYVPTSTSGARGNVLASIRNAVKGHGGFVWRTRQVDDVPAMAVLGAIGGVLGSGDGRQVREVETVDKDGKPTRAPVVSRRGTEERVLRGVIGALTGALAGKTISRGYVGRSHFK